MFPTNILFLTNIFSYKRFFPTCFLQTRNENDKETSSRSILGSALKHCLTVSTT